MNNKESIDNIIERKRQEIEFKKQTDIRQKEEKDFLKKINKDKKAYRNSISSEYSNELKKLKTDLFYYERLKDFYKEYVELTYDAELKYKKSEIYVRDLPLIIDFIIENKKALDEKNTIPI